MCLEQRGKGAMEGGQGPEHREGCGDASPVQGHSHEPGLGSTDE